MRRLMMVIVVFLLAVASLSIPVAGAADQGLVKVGLIGDVPGGSPSRSGMTVTAQTQGKVTPNWLRSQDVVIAPFSSPAPDLVELLKSGRRVYFYGPNLTLAEVFEAIGAPLPVDLRAEGDSAKSMVAAVGLGLTELNQWDVQALAKETYSAKEVVDSVLDMVRATKATPKTSDINRSDRTGGDATIQWQSDPNSYSQVASLQLVEEYKPYGKVIRNWQWYKAAETDTTKDYYVIHDSGDMYAGNYLRSLGDTGYWYTSRNWSYSLKNKQYSTYGITVLNYDPVQVCDTGSLTVGWGTLEWQFSGTDVCIATQATSNSILWNVIGQDICCQNIMPDHYKFEPGTKISVPNGQGWVSYTTDHTATFDYYYGSRYQYFKSWTITFYDDGRTAWF